MLWRNPGTGVTSLWAMDGSVKIGGGVVATIAPVWFVGARNDFNADGKADILWRLPASGATSLWLMNGAVKTSGAAARHHRPRVGRRGDGGLHRGHQGRPPLAAVGHGGDEPLGDERPHQGERRAGRYD